MVNSTIAVTLLTVTLVANSPMGRITTQDAPALRIERGAAQSVPMPGIQENIHNLLLNAFGRKPVPPGKVAIPIPGDVVTYEVIVSPPGAPRLIHARPGAELAR